MEPLDETFEDALRKFQASLTEKQRTDFKRCSLQDVKDTIRQVETSLRAQRRQRNLQRMSKFVEGMNQLGQVVEVFLNVDATVAFVWAPIKFVLLAASTWVETLDCLLDTYSEIGDVLPGLTRYKTLLAKHPFIKVHLEKYYCAVLEFHRKALDVFSRPNWKMAFHSAWKTFRSKFAATLLKLKRYRDFLSDEKITAAILEVQDLRQSVEEKLDELARKVQNLHIDDSESAALKHQEQLEKKRQSVLSKLDPPDYGYDFEKASKERQGTSSGSWVLENSTFEEWVSVTSSGNRSLYVHGIPGTGKTIFASWVVEYLKQMQRKSREGGLSVSVVYFFFKHSQPDKRDITGLLLSMISQLVSQDEVLLDLICQKLLSVDQQTTRSESLLRDLAATAIQSQRICFAVIDGLDECIGSSSAAYKDVQDEILDWFESVMSSDGSADKTVRLLISAQRNGCLEDRLSDIPAIQLERADAHLMDIKKFADAKSGLIQQKFSRQNFLIDETGRTDIVKRVCSGAKGMFLYAKIVLGNLLNQVSVGHFKRELRSENFPKGLEGAYERVVINVLENPNEGERDASMRILGLIVGAERPLMWKEIQSYFCIQIDDELADPDFQLENSCKYFCGSLVDIEDDNTDPKSGSEGFITLVHETARQYLLNTERLSFEQEDTDLALFCTRYLGSNPFSLGKDEAEIKNHFTTGYYGFVDYAAANWWKHVARVTFSKSTITTDTCFIAIFQAVAKLQATEGAAAADEVSNLRQQIQKLSNDGRGWEETLPIENRVKVVRAAIESLCEDKSVMEMEYVQQLYGHLSYKCHKPWCHYFLDGFETPQKRDDHVSEHERPFRCDYDGCFGRLVGFSVEIQLSKHNYRLHNTQAGPDFPPMAVGTSRKSRFNIYNAAAAGNLERVKECVETGADISRTYNHSFPLMLAAKNGHFEVCQYLLVQGADVNAQDKKGATALRAAVVRGDPDIVQLLISNEALTNLRDTSGDTPVGLADRLNRLAAFPQESITHKSCRAFFCHVVSIPHGRIRSNIWDSIMDESTIDLEVQDMIQRGCFDPNFEMVARNTATLSPPTCLTLNLALAKNRSIIASAIIETGRVNFNRLDHGRLPLSFACQYSTSKDIIMKLLLNTLLPDRRIYDGGTRYLHPLELVCLNQNLDSSERKLILSALLESGQFRINEPESLGRLPLHHACENGSTEAVELLLHHTTTVDIRGEDGKTPLELALEQKHGGVIDILLASGRFDVNEPSPQGDLPLHIACKFGLNQAVKLLLPLTRNINMKGRDGATALELALSRRNVGVIELLLESGRFDVNIPDQNCNLPLHTACRDALSEVVNLLLPRTTNINLKGGDGMTPLGLAVMYRYFDVVNILYKSRRVDVNTLDAKGRLPLHLACLKDWGVAVKLFLPWTRDIHARDSDDMTPLEIAVERGYVDIVNIFRRFKKSASFTMLDAVFSSPRFVEMGLTALHWGAWTCDQEIIRYQIGKQDTETLHMTPQSIPSGWETRLWFKTSSIRGDKWRSILFTPLLLLLNSEFAWKLANGQLSTISRTWETLGPSMKGLDLSTLCQHPFDDDQHQVTTVILMLVQMTRNTELHRHMADAGLTLPWTHVEWVGLAASFLVAGMIPSREEGEPLRRTILIEQNILLAIVRSHRCKFVDVMKANFDLAKKIMAFILKDSHPSKLNFEGAADNNGLLASIQRQEKPLATLRFMIDLGMDGYAALRHTAMVGRTDLVKLLVDTEMLDPLAEPKDEAGETACDIAARNGHPMIAMLLENKGFQFGTKRLLLGSQDDGRDSLGLAAKDEEEFVWRDILEEYTSPNNEIWDEE